MSFARNQYRSEFEAWQRRQRRRDILRHVVHRLALVAGGIALAVILYAALVGFYVIAGCVA